jgi:hypothetical protein
MATIFRKTAKGIDEIATRANRLAPRLRAALIMVDGARNDEQLAKLIAQNPTETLGLLLRLGFIEVAAVVEPAPERKPAGSNASVGGNAVTQGQEFMAFRKDAVRAFNDLVGPMGEMLALKMERASDREQLAPLLRLAVEIISHSRGVHAADQFKLRFTSS